MKKVIGIDLGTTNSVVAFKTSGVEVLQNKEGEDLTRSCIAFRNNEFIVGKTAYQLLHRDPQNTILSIKRLMGVAFHDEMVQKMIAESKQIRGYYRYTITQFRDGTEDAVAVVLGGKQYAPEQLSAEILKKLKADAEAKIGEVTHAVITVPAYFTEKQKAATRLAAKYAGLEVLKLLAEPTAAAIAYGVDNLKAGDATTVLIYDFGGGTFDLSVLNIVDGQYLEIGTGGDRWLGGDDIDRLLTNYVYKYISKTYGVSEAQIDTLIAKLPSKKQLKFLSEFRKNIESLKMELSSNNSAEFILEDLLEDENGDAMDIDFTMPRKDFESLIRPVIQRSMDLTDTLLQDINYDITMIDQILLVGGTACIPLVKQMLEKKYGANKIKLSKKPMYAVAEGAAILAHRLDESYVEPIPVSDGKAVKTVSEIAYTTNHNLFLMYRDKDGNTQQELIVEKQLPLPTTSVRKFKTSIDNQRIIKIEIKSDVEKGALETGSSVAFVYIDKDLPAESELIFEFELSIDEVLKVTVYPQTFKQLAKQVPITRGQKDARAFKTIDDEIRAFNQGDFGLQKQTKFTQLVVEQLKSAEKIGLDNALDERWAKITYETKELATQLKEQPQEDNTNYALIAKILMKEYDELIPDEEIEKMKKYIRVCEGQPNTAVGQQARLDLKNVLDGYWYRMLIQLFFVKLAAGEADAKNRADAQQLRQLHDAVIQQLKKENPNGAMQSLKQATELANRYINLEDMGKIITDIRR